MGLVRPLDIHKLFTAKKYKTHIIIGSLEHKKLIQMAQNVAQKNRLVQTHIISGANHFYSKHEVEVVEVIDSILGENNHE